MNASMWKQWDSQTNDRQIAYIELNNLYLSIESGRVELSRWKWNRLQILMMIVYPFEPAVKSLHEYWAAEFEKLPNWFNF